MYVRQRVCMRVSMHVCVFMSVQQYVCVSISL